MENNVINYEELLELEIVEPECAATGDWCSAV